VRDAAARQRRSFVSWPRRRKPARRPLPWPRPAVRALPAIHRRRGSRRRLARVRLRRPGTSPARPRLSASHARRANRGGFGPPLPDPRTDPRRSSSTGAPESEPAGGWRAGGDRNGRGAAAPSTPGRRGRLSGDWLRRSAGRVKGCARDRRRRRCFRSRARSARAAQTGRPAPAAASHRSYEARRDRPVWRREATRRVRPRGP
jgi:hypothetical protein